MPIDIDKKFISPEMATDAELASVASLKVDKVAGKQLSTEDYTTAEKSKLGGVAVGATANATDAQLRDRATHTGAQAIATVTGLQTALDSKYNANNPNAYETPAQLNARDTANRARANHTGTQLAATISDFAATVRGIVLTGLDLTSTAVLTVSDSILSALGKLQAQITAIVFGDFYQNAESATETSTTSTTVYQTKVTLTTPNLPLGDYLIIANYKFRTGANRAATFRIVVDGAAVKSDEPMVANASDFPAKTLRATLSGISGVKTINLDFKVGNSLNSSTTTVFISEASLTFWRLE